MFLPRQHLFPDSEHPEGSKRSSPDISQCDNPSGNPDLVRRLKSAPEDSLTTQLAKALCILNNNCGMYVSLSNLPGSQS